MKTEIYKGTKQNNFQELHSNNEHNYSTYTANIRYADKVRFVFNRDTKNFESK